MCASENKSSRSLLFLRTVYLPVVVCCKKNVSSSSSISSEIAFLDYSYEEQEEDEDMLLTCVFIGDYLCSGKEERPTFLCWKQNGMGRSYQKVNLRGK